MTVWTLELSQCLMSGRTMNFTRPLSNSKPIVEHNTCKGFWQGLKEKPPCMFERFAEGVRVQLVLQEVVEYGVRGFDLLQYSLADMNRIL